MLSVWRLVGLLCFEGFLGGSSLMRRHVRARRIEKPSVFSSTTPQFQTTTHSQALAAGRPHHRQCIRQRCLRKHLYRCFGLHFVRPWSVLRIPKAFSTPSVAISSESSWTMHMLVFIVFDVLGLGWLSFWCVALLALPAASFMTSTLHRACREARALLQDCAKRTIGNP